MKKRTEEHGKRNKELSEKLLKENVYFDWVITTAFYSAIHFVEGKILPCKINDIICNNINDVKTSYRMKGRHASRERLVIEKLPIEVSTRYKWLDDRSRYSRYTTYKISPSEAKKAQEYLSVIYKECIKINKSQNFEK